MIFSARAVEPGAVREAFVVGGLFSPEKPKRKGTKVALRRRSVLRR